MALDISQRQELCCPECGKPLIVEMVAEGRAKFIGCGRDCLEVYNIPDGSVAFGLQGAPYFLYEPANNQLTTY
jgi:hypothetical protein